MAINGLPSGDSTRIRRDMDGAVVDVLLLADAAHRLYQLEFVRYSDGPLLRPNWSTLEIAHCSTRQGAK